MSVQLSVHRGAFRTNLSQVVVPAVQKCQGLQCVEMSFSGLSLQAFRCELRRQLFILSFFTHRSVSV